MTIPLIAVAHGSRDPRSAATMRAVVDGASRLAPRLDVRLGFLDLSDPRLESVVDDLAAEGHRRAVVVPLLLGDAYHSRVDLPALLARTEARHSGLRLHQAPVLGADPSLVLALRERIERAGAALDDPEVGVLIAAVGASREAANQRARALARQVALGTSWAGAATCFATSAHPSVDEAISALRARGARRIVAGHWFLAPGLLTERIRDAAAVYAPEVVHAAPLGTHRAVAELLVRRYTDTLHAWAAGSVHSGSAVALSA